MPPESQSILWAGDEYVTDDNTSGYEIDRRDILKTVSLGTTISGIAGYAARSTEAISPPDVVATVGTEINESPAQPGDTVRVRLFVQNTSDGPSQVQAGYNFFSACGASLISPPEPPLSPDRIIDHTDAGGDWNQGRHGAWWEWEAIEPYQTLRPEVTFRIPSDIETGTYQLSFHVSGDCSQQEGHYAYSDSVSLRVEPPSSSFDITADSSKSAVPGGQATITVTLKNTGQAAGQVWVQFQSPSNADRATAEYYSDDFTVVSHNDDGATWNSEGWVWDEVSPGDERETSVTLQLAEDLQPGEYTFAIRATDGDMAMSTVSVQESVEPVIDERSVKLDRYAATIDGTQPEVAVQTENASRVTVESSHHTSPVDLADDGEWWRGHVPLTESSSSGDRVTLTITAESPTGQTTTLKTVPDRFLREVTATGDPPLCYYLFEDVWDIVVVIGEFPQGGTSLDPTGIERWKQHRARDMNTFLASAKGLFGRLGLNISYLPADSDTLQMPETFTEYTNLFRGIKAVDQFMQDIEAQADPSLPGSDNDLWIGTHHSEDTIGDAVGPLSAEGYYNHNNRWIYAPEALQQSLNNQRTWVHELGHAFGYGHTSNAGHTEASDDIDAMGAGPINRRVTADLGDAIPPYSSVIKLGDTLGYEQRNVTSFGDFFETDETDLSGNGRSGTTTLVEFTQLHGDPDETERDTVPLFSHPAGISGNDRYVLEYRDRLQGFDNSSGENQWGTSGDGSVVVYRHSTSVFSLPSSPPSWEVLGSPQTRYLSSVGDELTVNLSSSAYELCFRLADYTTDTDGRDSVHIEWVKRIPNGTCVVLSSQLSLPSQMRLRDGEVALARPSLHLLVTDENGRRAGVTTDGSVVNEIPGAEISGRKHGEEWIVVPDDASIEYTVSSTEVTEYIDALVRLGVVEKDQRQDFLDEFAGEYELQKTEYTSNSELVTENGDVTVTETSIYATSDVIEAGATQDIGEEDLTQVQTPANEEASSEIDLEAIVGGGAVVAGLAYLAVRMHASSDSD